MDGISNFTIKLQTCLKLIIIKYKIYISIKCLKINKHDILNWCPKLKQHSDFFCYLLSCITLIKTNINHVIWGGGIAFKLLIKF